MRYESNPDIWLPFSIDRLIYTTRSLSALRFTQSLSIANQENMRLIVSIVRMSTQTVFETNDFTPMTWARVPWMNIRNARKARKSFKSPTDVMLSNQIIASILHLPLSWFIKNLFRDNRMLSRLGILFDAIFRARGATRTREGSVLFGST